MLSNIFSDSVALESVALVSIDLQNLFSRMGAGGLQAALNMASVVRDSKGTPITRVGAYMDKHDEGPDIAEQGFCQVSTDDFHFLHAKSVSDAIRSTHPRNNNTTLEKRFNDLNITHIVMGGFLTNWCVEASAITAQKRGFKVAVLTDCVHDFGEEIGNEGIIKMRKHGVIMTDSKAFQRGLFENLQLSA